jgi:hypothetical protein
MGATLYYIYKSLRAHAFKAGLDYGEEVHRSINNFNPRQGYLRQESVWQTRREKKKYISMTLDFFGGQVSCARV